MKRPTLKQGYQLRMLGGASIVLAPGRRDWGSVLRRGWVEPILPDDPDKRFLPPLRITPEGVRALADAMDAYPELTPEIKRSDYPQVNELPAITKLKAERDEARFERDEARRQLQYARGALSRCQRTISEVIPNA